MTVDTVVTQNSENYDVIQIAQLSQNFWYLVLEKKTDFFFLNLLKIRLIIFYEVEWCEIIVFLEWLKNLAN